MELLLCNERLGVCYQSHKYPKLYYAGWNYLGLNHVILGGHQLLGEIDNDQIPVWQYPLLKS